MSIATILTNVQTILTNGQAILSIINARTECVIEHNILNKALTGFFLSLRTSNHIFVILNLINKCVNQDKVKSFAYFTGFQKAFDSVWHRDYSTNDWNAGWEMKYMVSLNIN